MKSWIMQIETNWFLRRLATTTLTLNFITWRFLQSKELRWLALFLIMGLLAGWTATAQVCQVSTLAGDGAIGFMDGAGSVAQFTFPNGVAIDGQGNVYVADQGNHRIRRIDGSGNVSTLAGDGTAGFMDGTGSTAQFSSPSGVAVDGQGNVYVADLANQRIRKIDGSGNVSTIAGTGTSGFMDGAGNIAQFASPADVAVDGQGNIYVADLTNQRIRKIDGSGNVSTIAGTGTSGFMDGAGNLAQFANPSEVAVDGQGNLYVADFNNNRIRKIDGSGTVSTLAGTGTSGFMDGAGSIAQFQRPSGVAVDGQGNIYVADFNNDRIRKIDGSGIVSTFAGSGMPGFMDGAGSTAQFNIPSGVAVDGQGNVYVTEWDNNRIRKITCASCIISSISVANLSTCSPNGLNSIYTADVTVSFVDAPSLGNLVLSGDGSATVAVGNLSSTTSHTFTGVSLPAHGGAISLTATFDAQTSCTYTNQNIGIAPIACSCSIEVSTLAGDGATGFMDGAGSVAQFRFPNGVAIDGQGNVYVADQGNNRIRKIDGSGNVSTFAGDGTAGFMDGPGSVAQFSRPSRVAVDGQGNIYVADEGNHRIRKIDVSGTVSTIAGTGASGFLDGAGSIAQFNFPNGVAVDGQGTIYVADEGNHRIRKIDVSGNVSTIAGTGTSGFMDGAGNLAQFANPSEVAVDGQGNIYVADFNNNRIRKIDGSGTVSTLAGTGTSGFMDGAGSIAQFQRPSGVAVDGQGNIYVADFNNNRIRKIDGSGIVSTFAGSGMPGFMDGAGSTAQFNIPSGVAVDGQGNVYVTEWDNNRIRKIACQGSSSSNPGFGEPGCGGTSNFTIVDSDVPGVNGIFRTNGMITTNGGVVIDASDGNIEFRAGTSIVLQPGFVVQAGGSFSAIIESCSAFQDQPIDQAFVLSTTNTDTELKIVPNPASEEVNFQFNLSEALPVTLSIFNTNGQLVAYLVSNQKGNKGDNNIRYNVQKLEEGMFYVVLRTGKDIQTKKMVILNR